MLLAWGAKVSPAFRARVVQIGQRVPVPDPSWLMACMAFETGETFSPSVMNGAGSGAVGLIQFMPSTLAALKSSTEEAAAMSAVDQLALVEAYFLPWRGRLKSLGDVYGAILWPGMIGKPDNAVIFRKNDPARPKLYLQNKGLDADKDGDIEKCEIVAKVKAMLDKGLLPQNAFNL